MLPDRRIKELPGIMRLCRTGFRPGPPFAFATRINDEQWTVFYRKQWVGDFTGKDAARDALIAADIDASQS